MLVAFMLAVSFLGGVYLFRTGKLTPKHWNEQPVTADTPGYTIMTPSEMVTAVMVHMEKGHQALTMGTEATGNQGVMTIGTTEYHLQVSGEKGNANIPISLVVQKRTNFADGRSEGWRYMDENADGTLDVHAPSGTYGDKYWLKNRGDEAADLQVTYENLLREILGYLQPNTIVVKH
jgi:hypothetical protein